jgi:hypothetical protein
MTPEQAGRAERSGRAERAVRWLFVSRSTGRLTVAQWPNLPLAVFLVVSAVSRIFHPSGDAETWLRVLGVIALIAWALDELVRGVNPFRRILGAAVLAVTVADLVLH